MTENDTLTALADTQVRLLEEITSLLRTQKQVPWDNVLWTTEDIAEHLKVSPRTVAEKYACQPSFPRAVRPGGGHARYYATEIVDWVWSTRDRKLRRN